MKERPILFNSEMVRAILENRKTQTRRVIKPQPEVRRTAAKGTPYPLIALAKCPYGQPGDRLWVRETWAWPGEEHVLYRADPAAEKLYFHMMTDENYPQIRWKPSIHMPRWASRITLEVTDVRVERVWEIDGQDCLAEGISMVGDYFDAPLPMGVDQSPYGTPIEAFRDLWDSINAKRGFGWDVNPWVWVVEFEKVEGGE